MLCFNTVLVILWCITVIMGVRDGNKSAWIEHNHFVSMDCYSCNVPQPRVFSVQDLVSPLDWKNKYEPKKERIIPPATVLHRCDNAGYCAGWGEKCVNTKTDYVNLTFAFKPELSLNQRTGKLDYFNIPFQINHTHCSCEKPVINNIK